MPPSELTDGYEPHGLIYSAVMTGVADDVYSRGRRGVPGVMQLGGYRVGTIPGTNPASQIPVIYSYS